MATARSRFKNIDETINEGNADELKALREEIIDLRNRIETQLADDKFDTILETSELLSRGMSPQDAALLAKTGGPVEWRGRARHLLRRCHEWLRRIKERLPKGALQRAVVVPGVGRSAQTVADACNRFLERGCWIGHLAIVGPDLVLIASEPEPPASA